MDFALLFSSYASRLAGRKISQQQMLYEALREAIRTSELSPGMRLLPSRVLAQELRIARNSVLYAYERLSDEGFVLTRRQGSTVAGYKKAGASHTGKKANALHSASQIVPHAAPHSAPHAAPAGTLPGTRPATARQASTPDAPASAIPQTRGQNVSRALSPGMPALDLFPIAKWRRAVDRAWQHAGPAELGYMNNEGHPALRQSIADYLKVSRGVRCEVPQIFITDGTQTSLDVCTATLLSHGKTVWFEDPGYAGARAAFHHAGLRIVPMPVDVDGMVTSSKDWRDQTPDVVYLTPSHQYPLGSVLSLPRRIALLEEARAHGSWIIEDDYDSEFRHDGPPLPALQGLEADTPVIYMGTFSKTLFPALKISFMVVPSALAARIGQTLASIRRQGRIVDQMALADFIDTGAYARHLRSMKQVYAQRRRALLGAIDTHLTHYVTVSGGPDGMHLTVRLDAPLQDTAVSMAAMAQGFALSPLSEYCHRQTPSGSPLEPSARFNGFVLGYANLAVNEANAYMARIAQLITGLLEGTSS